MIGRPAVIRTALSIIITLFFITTQAQPILPDMAGITDKGVNILTWTCQYDGIKSIAVQRSSDSLMNFSTVGYVKNLKKGVQVFADGHPQPGNNYYELLIVFSSDLTWTSNRIKLFVDSAVMRRQHIKLPPNDSLQKYLTTSTHNIPEPPKDEPAKEIAYHEHFDVKHVISTQPDTTEVRHIDQVDNVPTVAATAKHKKAVIVVGTKDDDIVTSIDPSLHKVVATNDSLKKKQQRITISLIADATELDALDYVRSEHVFTDALSGNITITLPEVRSHLYTMRIYDQKNRLLFDIPRLADSPIIMDKRNFHESGLYKFTLKRDNKEYETGLVSVSLDQ